MNEAELEDAIWKVTEYPITKTNVWRAVHGDKQTCLKKINEMVATSRLKEEETGKNRAMTVTRINTENKAEFEYMLNFQVHYLGECRKAWSKLKSGMFEPPQYIIHCEPPLPHSRKMGKIEGMRVFRKKGLVEYKGEKYKIVEEIPTWKIKRNRKQSIDSHLDRMGMYQNALLLFIARVNFQRSLGLISHSEANRRTLKIQRAFDNHIKKFLNLNLKEIDALRQYVSWKTVMIEGFRIV